MATDDDSKARGRITSAHDDLRDTLAMLAILVGSRVQRDTEGRDDGDVEAEAVLTTIRRQLGVLFEARHGRLSRSTYLAMVDELAKVYLGAPPTRNASPAWQAYVARVHAILSPDEGIAPTKATRWCLIAHEIRTPSAAPRKHAGGAKEAAKAAVADVLGVGAGTLVNWRTRDRVEPSADWVPRQTFFGEAVHFPDAIGDVVELLRSAEVPLSCRVVDDALSEPSDDSGTT